MYKTENPALVVIDVQKAIDCFSEGERSNLNAESNIKRLIEKWRAANLPVVHIRHSSKSQDSPYHASSSGYEFKSEVSPGKGEHVVTKRENCAFLGTQLERYLKQRGISELIICGVLVNHSVDATIRVAAGLGFKVFLPGDATAAFGVKALNGKCYSSEDVYWLFLSNLSEEYCKVVTTDQAMSGI